MVSILPIPPVSKERTPSSPGQIGEMVGIHYRSLIVTQSVGEVHKLMHNARAPKVYNHQRCTACQQTCLRPKIIWVRREITYRVGISRSVKFVLPGRVTM